MMYFVNITSQGQISIPVKIRRKHQMDKAGQVIVREEDNRIVLEKVPDILALRGVFASKTKKRASHATERRAFEEAMAHGGV